MMLPSPVRLTNAPLIGGDSGVDKIAAEPSEARERAVLVGSSKPRVADHVGDQDCRQFPGLAHRRANLRQPYVA